MTRPDQDQPTDAAGSLCERRDTDEILFSVLDEYLQNRERGHVPHQQFVSAAAERHPNANLNDQLPGLLTSLDALHAFAPGCVEHPADEIWENLVSNTLGDFEILGEIGRGGMGIVYKARQVSLDRVVALKVLPLSVVLDRQQIARFMVEAQAAGQLNHPNIVPIYSVGQEAGVHCYSMPWIQGPSLDKLIVHRPVDPEQATRWIIQAADAIEHAHQRGVIHRDIKPSNLLIDRDNKLWVADFGLARCRHNAGLTHSGAVVGTFRYMSPEQASGNQAIVDHRCDIYSLGATLYELLSGKNFGGENATSALSKHQSSSEPKPIRRLNSAVSRDLETVVMKAMAPLPPERYHSSGAFADDLVRILGGRPILARRSSLADRLTKWALRHRRMVATTAAVTLLAFIGSLVMTTQVARQKAALQSALTRADRNLLVADRNFKQAQANFRQTREVLDHFGLMAAERLRGVAGAETLRENLVRDLLTYYETFADQAESAPDLQRELAETHLRAAEIIEEVGATYKALATYERAADLLSELPPTPSVRHEIALCRNSIAILNAQHGETDRAVSIYRGTIDRLKSLDRPHTLATVHGNFGLLLASLDRKAEARREFEHAIDQVSGTKAGQTSISLTTAMIWNNLGHLVQDEDLEQSLAFNENAIRTLRQAASSELEVTHALAMSLSNQAAILDRLDRRDEAIGAYQESIMRYRGLVDRVPMAVRYSEELATSYNNLGRLLHRQALDQEARTVMTHAKDLMQSLAQRRPNEIRYRKALEGMKHNLDKLAP